MAFVLVTRNHTPTLRGFKFNLLISGFSPRLPQTNITRLRRTSGETVTSEQSLHGLFGKFPQKMLKYLLTLTLAAAATCQTIEPLPYQQNLDPGFVVSWGLSNDTITIEMLYASGGWGALYLLADDGALLDVWWGGYDEDYSSPYLQVDQLNFIQFANLI